MTYQNHPAADLFPMMGKEELGLLADDIAANGLLEPIIIHHDLVLDGRNRLAACQLADVEPQFIEMNGNVPSPVLYVLSRNLHRRHLTTSQRAAIAADMIPMLEGEAHERQTANLKNHQPSSSVRNRHDEAGRSREIAAKTLGIGTTAVGQAVKVKRESPEVFEKVKRGEISVNAAAAGHVEQPRIGGEHSGPTTLRYQQSAESQKQRMISALSTANGICVGLESLDAEKVAHVCDAKEIKQWAEKAREIANKFRAVAKRLEQSK